MKETVNIGRFPEAGPDSCSGANPGIYLSQEVREQCS